MNLGQKRNLIWKDVENFLNGNQIKGESWSTKKSDLKAYWELCKMQPNQKQTVTNEAIRFEKKGRDLTKQWHLTNINIANLDF